MKKFILCCLLLTFTAIGYAQKIYNVGDETLELNIEVEGELDLLWTITDGNYRYFVRSKDGKITELKNTRGEGRTFNKEYVEVLKNLTSNNSAENVKLTTGSLKRFIDRYNKSLDINYNIRDTNLKVNFRLSLFSGITNHPLVENLSENNSNFQVASEIELYGDTDNPIHSGLLQLRQTFGSSDGDYKSTEFSLGYRIRFLRKKGFNIYAQTRFASVNIFSVDVPIFTDDVATPIGFETRRESEFDVPFIFGIGADFKITSNGYLSIIYDRFYAFGLDNRDDFPMDFMIGYKLKL